ncbi:LexA family protein [Lysinibacillus xylanilyticus]|uniref:LexA family protein n=1 Tax=Lysinibacillus xylanilyticus TaxID=582475 RepID=UPI0037F121EF
MKSIEVAKRIERIAEKKGISGAELARRIGTDRSTITRYYKGIRKISMEEIPKFAEVLEVDVIELLFGSDIKNINIVSEKKVAVPILGKIACGEPILAKENIENYIYKPADSLPSGDVFALQAKGDSMEPMIPNGAIVLLRAQPDVENGEIAAVLVNGDEEATLKRVKKQGDTVFLMPDNSKYAPYIVDENNPARIIGKAISYEMVL